MNNGFYVIRFDGEFYIPEEEYTLANIECVFIYGGEGAFDTKEEAQHYIDEYLDDSECEIEHYRFVKVED